MAITFKEELTQQVPEKANVYQLSKLNASTNAVVDIAKQLGLKGEQREYCISPDSTVYREGPYRVEVHKRSGALYYHDESRYGLQTEKEFELEDTRAEEIANDFLRSANIIPKNESKLLKVTHLRGAVSSVGNRTDLRESVIDASIIYGRFIDKISVEGPGGKAMVNIDPEGEVVGTSLLWRPLSKKIGSVKVKKRDLILNEMKKYLAEIKGNVTVTKARFGYFEFDKYDLQKILQPVYTFIFNVENEEIARRYIKVIPAGTKIYAPLKERKKFPIKQIVRTA